tara:strand:- start:173 stop:622 length:450 start_codon:yes stop_codon:yes gene_type:complete
MSKNWGQATWLFLHSLSYKIKDDKFLEHKNEIIEIFAKICASLPCPDCQEHAKNYVIKNDLNKINSKNDFIEMLWVFHNIVNKRQGKKEFPYKSLIIYNKTIFINVCQNFINIYNRPINNQRLLLNSMGRDRVTKHVISFVTKNKDIFN